MTKHTNNSQQQTNVPIKSSKDANSKTHARKLLQKLLREIVDKTT